VIKTTYNATSMGRFSKDITVSSNAKKPIVRISFVAEVVNPADTITTATPSAPIKK
jgi:hypothetical protein